MSKLRNEIEAVKRRNAILKELENMAEDKGFIKVESDYFEDFLEYENLNPRINLKELVKVQDLKGNVLILKPDITTNIIKQVLSKMETNLQLNLYYSDYTFSFNEFGSIKTNRQFGVEVLGRKGIDADIDVLGLVMNILDRYRLDFIVEMGNATFINLIFDELKLNRTESLRLKQILTKKNKDDLITYSNTFDQNGYAILLNAILERQNDLNYYKEIIMKYNLNNKLRLEINRLEEIKNQTDCKNVQFDLTLLNEFDYYNGPTFKVYVRNLNKEIIRGGRYDSLTKEDGNVISALGFSLDLNAFIKEVTAVWNT